VIATHQIPEAQELCNKVCLLRAGSLMAVRSLEELAVEGVDLHEFYLRVMGWREREGADYQELAVPCQTVETT
jgi:ABC-type multidrug transport system ATPase subunit